MNHGPWSDESLAANGKPVRENFSAWFADSKVLDKQGLPEVVFHVANNDFDSFDRSKIGSAYGDKIYKMKGIAPLGFYFSNKIQGGVDGTPGVIDVAPGRAGENPSILPVYLSFQNPLIVDTPYNATDHADIFSKTIKKAMRDHKFDGVIIRGEEGSAVFVATKATQIKSATGNSGLYLRRSGSMTDAKEALDLQRSHQAKLAITELTAQTRPRP